MMAREAVTACAVCEVHADAVFRVEGMDCRDEVVLLERRLKPLPGVESLVADVVSRHGRLDVLVSAAGTLAPASFLELTPEQWDRTLAVNVRGTVFLAQACARHFLTAGTAGRITRVSRAPQSDASCAGSSCRARWTSTPGCTQSRCTDMSGR